MEKRLPREEAVREDLRKNERVDRHAYRMAQIDPFFIPHDKIPPGISLKYVRVEFTKNGEEIDSNNLRKHSQAKWIPVSPDEFPEINGQDFLRPDHPFKKSIYNNGHILMKRPIEYLEIDLEMYEERNEGALRGIRGSMIGADDRTAYTALDGGRELQTIKNRGYGFADW